MNLTDRPIYAKGQKPAPVKATGKDPAHLAAVSALPCVVCWEWGMAQLSPTQVHHCIHGRYGNRKTPDRMTIPLCEGHHLGDFDKSKIAIHRQPNAWRAAYGEDREWISWVEVRTGYA